MRAGNVFTIEPMISEGRNFSFKFLIKIVNKITWFDFNTGTWRDKQWPDNWWVNGIYVELIHVKFQMRFYLFFFYF